MNDRLGHQVGDVVLQAVAKRMQDTVRSGDTVARIGGDEFVVLLKGVTSRAQAQIVAGKLTKAIAAPIDIEACDPVTVTLSVGISLFPEDGADCQTLIQCADQRMYVNKKH